MTVTGMFADQPVASQFIGGEWRDGSSDRTVDVTNPYDDTVVTSIRLADASDLDAAYEAAQDAQREWAATGPAGRRKVMLAAAEILRSRRHEIVDWLVRESGSTMMKAHIEVSLAVTMTQEAASFPTRVSGQIFDTNTPNREVRVERGPVGVVGVISPWNFPLHLTQRSVAPALALGNAVVIKPASDTPVTGGLLLARVFEEAGLPAGVLNVVVGAGSEIGDEFVAHRIPGLISFTGSTPVGKNVGRVAMTGDHLKPVALELGGNAPFVVLADADLDAAVHAAVGGAFLHSGQICMAVNRIIVEEPVREAFVEKFVAATRSVAVGDPGDKRTLVGPIINDSQVESLQGKIALARDEGATVELDGKLDGRVLPPPAHLQRRLRGVGARPRGDLRPTRRHPRRTRRRPRPRAGQRGHLRPHRLRVHPGPRPRPALRPPHGIRHGVRQRGAHPGRGARRVRRHPQLRPRPF